MKKVFISSTCFDLVDIRAEIAASLEAWGYEPVYNESPNFPKRPGLHSHDICIEAVKDCDYYLLIVDKRYGGPYSGGIIKNTDGKSITWCEAEAAYEKGMPVFTFVRKNTWTERPIYKNNKEGNQYKPTFVEKVEVFDFIDFIVKKNNDNWIEQFEDSVQIKEKLQPWLKQAGEQKKSKHIISKLHYITEPAPHFTGRKDYLEAITNWYGDAKEKVGCLEGFGGIGKSSIVRRWYDDMAANGVSPEGIFWWGFYKDHSLDNFLDHLLEFACGGRPEEEIKGSFRKMELALERLAGMEVLIVLDGFEEMQKGEEAGESFGCCVHAEMRELLRGFCDGDMKGLCLVTTRYPLKDIVNWEGKGFAAKKVDGLSDEDAVVLLREFGIKGEEGELKALTKGFEGHALCVTLVATSLAEYYGGDILKAGEIPPLATDKEAGGKAHRILEWYDKQLSDEERTFLQIFSLFRRVVGSDDLAVFTGDYSFNNPIAGMTGFNLRKLAVGLVKRRLLSGAVDDELDAHPLVRDYFAHTFGDEEKRACHEAIYRHIGKTAPEMPDTLEEMAPLFAMVRHGCAAGLHDEVLDEVYWEKIMRADRNFLVRNLGAWETDLSLVCYFFPKGDFGELPLLTKPADQCYLMNEAAAGLKSIGRPEEALPLYQKKIEMQIADKDWRNTSGGYQNLADLQYLCGDLEGALESAGKALGEAGKLEDEKERKVEVVYPKTYLAWCSFLAGEREMASKYFLEADRLEREFDPNDDGLYSQRGVRYAEFLLRSDEISKARSSTERNLEISESYNVLSDISKCHCILGKIDRVEGNYPEAAEQLEQALAIAMKIGMPELEIDALLARGRLFTDIGEGTRAVKDANRVLTLVERTTFYLYEPDALNILARASILEGDKPAARGHAESAKEKAEKMGYALAKEDAEGILEEL